MNRKLVLTTIFVTIIIGMFGLSFKIQRVEASGTIYIRANGLVEGTNKIANAGNITYTFTDDITDSIVVERSNIIVDGARFTLRGTGSGNGFDLSGINNVTIKNINIKNFTEGIYAYSSSFNIFSGNNITANNYDGICLDSCSNNSIIGNNIANNDYGILLDVYSSNNSIIGNNIANNDWGIDFEISSHNSIIGNNITANNDWGINIYSSWYNSIIANNITNNHYGVGIFSSSYNSIYHNNFVGNKAYASDCVNYWDDGYPSGGNYWSDYYSGVDEKSGPNQDLSGSDGIGDTPYVIDESNTDHYPLMNFYVIPEFASFLIPSLFMITTLLATTAYRRKRMKSDRG